MKKFSKILVSGAFGIVLSFGFAGIALAADPYTVLAPLPGIGDTGTGQVTINQYLPSVFNLSIAVAAVMAFVMITFGGILYATSDAITGKSQGRQYVTDAIWGLLLVIGAWVILNTINPKILTFTLDVQDIVVQNATSTVVGSLGGTAPTNGTGCKGICQYQYVNAKGESVSYKDCASCVPTASLTDLNFKDATINGKPTQINAALGQALLATKNAKGTPGFRISESWPPTVNHREQGQYDGTSVDVGLSAPSAAAINAFVANAKANGLTAVYEVTQGADVSKYIAAGVNPSYLLPVSYATAEHFSIYKR